LPVEHKVAIVGIGVQQGQELVYQLDQAEAKLLKGQVPLAVPMGVRNDVNGVHGVPS